MITFFIGGTSRGSSGEPANITRQIATAINGDLSPTAKDQMQVFVSDSLAVKNDTAYWYYTANGQGDGTSDIDIVAMATKDLSSGLIYEGWNRYKDGNPDAVAVLDVGSPGAWDDGQVFIRTAFYDTDDNIFKFWYIGESGSIRDVGYATSIDGFNITKHPSNPIYNNTAPFSNQTIFFAVYKENPTLYHALAQGNRNVNEVGAVYLTSSDGISWSEQQNPVFIGTGIRSIQTIRKYNGIYYLWCEYGFNDAYQENLGGVPTDIQVYSTTDFINVTNLGSLLSYDEPNGSGLQGSCIFEYNSINYCGYGYFKNQVKAINLSLAEEPFSALRMLESDKPFYNLATHTNNYPSYLKKYYPLYEKVVTQSPIERIDGDTPTVTGTLTWNNRKYCEFDGTQTIEYPNYTPTNLTNFAVKARVSQTLTGGPHIVRQDDGVNRFWSMYLNGSGLLVVLLFDASNNIAKNYRTTSAIVKPPGVYDVYDEVSVGFIFNNGTLDVLFGDGIQPVTKVTDDVLTEISPKDTPVLINGNGVSIDIRSICIFDEITEDQWLNVIDL
jgi:hypothetical protein